MTIPHITKEQFTAVSPARVELLEIFNKRIDKVNAEQQETIYPKISENVLDAAKEQLKYRESKYITAAQARELGAGKAEWSCEINGEHWYACTDGCGYASHSQITGVPIKYRAIKQAQPEPVDPHAAEIAALKAQIAELIPFSKFGAHILGNYKGGYVSDSEIGAAALACNCILGIEENNSYAPNIEATIEQLLKD
jgi:hypothetical protein